MNRTIRETVNQHGFVLIRKYHPQLQTATAASHFGTPLHLYGFSQVQILKPRSQAQYAPNTYSGNYGLNDFPLHTDLAHWPIPPRYIVLRCINGINEVSTRLLNSNKIIKTIGELSLRRTLVQPRRPLINNRPLLRLLDKRTGSASCLRWDELFISPATPSSKITFSNVHEYIETAKVEEIALVDSGDILIIDNWQMLHGRSAISPIGEERIIERIYIGELL